MNHKVYSIYGIDSCVRYSGQSIQINQSDDSKVLNDLVNVIRNQINEDTMHIIVCNKIKK